MDIINNKGSVPSKDLSAILHCIRVKRFSRAAELLVKIRGVEPNKDTPYRTKSLIKTKWKTLYQMRRETSFSTEEIAQEVLSNVEEWLDNLS